MWYYAWLSELFLLMKQLYYIIYQAKHTYLGHQSAPVVSLDIQDYQWNKSLTSEFGISLNQVKILDKTLC